MILKQVKKLIIPTTYHLHSRKQALACGVSPVINFLLDKP